MQIMWRSIIQNWNLSRWIRLGLGIIILVQAVVAADIMVGIMGAMLILMPLLNVGCCSTAGYCSTGKARSGKELSQTEFEEVK